MIAALLRFLVWPYLFFARFALKRHRVRSLTLPSLGINREILEAIVGDDCEVVTDPVDPTHYDYYYGFFHVLRVWYDENGLTNRYLYISIQPDPADDLSAIADHYGEGIGWDDYEPGYMYIRKDKKVTMNCSAAPMIGVKLSKFKTSV